MGGEKQHRRERSLPAIACPPTRLALCRPKTGAQGQTRTADRTIFSRELYQLSYLSKRPDCRHPNAASLLASEPVGDRGLEPLTSTV